MNQQPKKPLFKNNAPVQSLPLANSQNKPRPAIESGVASLSAPNAALYQKLLQLVSMSSTYGDQVNSQMNDLLSNPEIRLQLRQLHTQLLKNPNQFLPKLEALLLKQASVEATGKPESKVKTAQSLDASFSTLTSNSTDMTLNTSSSSFASSGHVNKQSPTLKNELLELRNVYGGAVNQTNKPTSLQGQAFRKEFK